MSGTFTSPRLQMASSLYASDFWLCLLKYYFLLYRKFIIFFYRSLKTVFDWEYTHIISMKVPRMWVWGHMSISMILSESLWSQNNFRNDKGIIGILTLILFMTCRDIVTSGMCTWVWKFTVLIPIVYINNITHINRRFWGPS